MAGHAPDVAVKELPGAKIAIISATWHDDICADLIAGAERACVAAKAESTVIRVPGSFELPLAAQFAFEKGFDAAVVLGVVVQGDTPHFTFICDAVANGIMDLNIKYQIPVIFGVLTTNTLKQAQERSGGKHGNKGVEAAATALQMIALKQSLQNF